jgi:SAM-dependent methyltransferase
MDVTNRFVLDYALRVADARPGSTVLDFGCGAGKLVDAGVKAGLQIVGVDVFYAGSTTKQDAADAGLLNTCVFEIVDGRIPFPDNSFDLVVNNQVMEHVEDLDAVLREIHRVLRPGGTVLSLFPSRDVWREGHIGIPFSHRLPKGSTLRFYYTWALRVLGLGTWKEQAPTTRQWAIDKLAWIDAFTCYRPRQEIFLAYGAFFESELIEMEYINYRLLDRPGREWVVKVLRLPGMSRLAQVVFRKLAFLVIRSRKAAR